MDSGEVPFRRQVAASAEGCQLFAVAEYARAERFVRDWFDREIGVRDAEKETDHDPLSVILPGRVKLFPVILPLAVVEKTGKMRRMSYLADVVKRIDERLKAMTLSASGASRAAGLSEDAIRNIRRASTDESRVGTQTTTLMKLAPILGTSVNWLLTGIDAEMTVKLAGFVGAGQEVYQFDEDGAGYVDAPPGAVTGTEAVEVRGGSMLPLYEDGTILYYSRQLPPTEMVGKRCIVRLEDDRTLVKTLRRGAERGLFTLVSLNAPDIEDVGVRWAAPIDWIKP